MTKSAQQQEHYAAAGQLLREHNRALVRFLRGRLHSEHEARKVAQEAYVRLLQLDHPDATGFLRAQLFRIAADLSADSLRERQTRRHIVSAGILDGLTPGAAPMANDCFTEQEFARVQLVLGELSAEYRRAFVLHAVEGRGTAEIARKLNLPAFAVRHYVSLALCRVAESLQRMHRVGRDSQ